MTAFDTFTQSFNTHFSYQQSNIKQEQYLPMMDSFPEYNPMAWTNAYFAGGDQDYKLDMMRALSDNAVQHTHSDIAPSLHSTTSLPSSSSSTVGSPYSGHAQLDSNPNLQYGGPAIVYDNDFSHAYETAHFDHESYFQESKLDDISVGKSEQSPTLAQTSSTVPASGFLSVMHFGPVSTSTPSLAESSPQPPIRTQSEHDIFKNDLTPAMSGFGPGSASVFKASTYPASAYPKAPSFLPGMAERTVAVQQLSQSPDASGSPLCGSKVSLPSIIPSANHIQFQFFSQSSDPGVLTGSQDVYNSAAYGYQQQPVNYSPAPSPAPSCQSYASFSQPITVNNFSTDHPSMRRRSITSLKSIGSPRTPHSVDEDSREKGQCPFPECGKIYKDLKAHLISHGADRPEKCPIVSCEYHTKGFARKYDKNRHTLTHYRGTMICGFCPGSGTANENTFNRADVFKRHLTSKHGVEQTPPNSRKRSPSKSNIKLSAYCKDATGKCSTCSTTFSNAQEFYEHLDDCVLRVVQQEDPSEAVNARHMLDMVDDSEVQATFERNNIRPEGSPPSLADDDEEDEEDDEDDEEDEDSMDTSERCGKGVIKASRATSTRAVIGGNICKKTNKKGLTWSKGGHNHIGKSRKRRKFYPPSWGMAAEKMNMKHRVLIVNDGQRRLHKDDMMMHNMFEVRMPLLDGKSYVTDLDIETLKRAEGFHNALPEEKGPWIPEQDFLQLFEQ